MTYKLLDVPSIIIAQLRMNSKEAHVALTEDGDTAGAARWDNHEKDLIALSRHFPTTLFHLDGKDTDGAMWTKQFLNGKVV